MSSPHDSLPGPSSWLPTRAASNNSADEISTPRPILRRGSVASDRSGALAQSPSSYAPPQARSFDSEEARERQRTMDVESAMLLSRARSSTVTHQGRSHPHPGSPMFDNDDDELNYPMLSRREEEEMTLARGEYDPGPSTVGYDAEQEDHIPTRLPEEPPDILDSLTAETAEPIHAPPPIFPQQSFRDVFDFAAMEAFAAEERVKLGFATPPKSAGLDDLRRRLQLKTSRPQPAGQPEPQAATSPSSEKDGKRESFAQARQRRLSQSHPKPRIRSGKLAMFEGDLGTPPSLGVKALSGPSVSFGASLSPPTSHPHRQDSGHDRPFRFSFYSNAISSTIHSRSICELPSESQTFEQLFTGEAESHGETKTSSTPMSDPSVTIDPSRISKTHSKQTIAYKDEDISTWWLDVLRPTDEEMRMFSKVFSIHPLTTEDILMEETREKIELFRHYYLVCFRGFDQDPYSPTYLEPVNMYIIVFREGILSFHFSATPHPLNVRRRIKQLKDYIAVTSDWISYALIDDITDAFGPLIQSIEYEVDNIDEHVLILKDQEQSDMLRRIGTCRKKVMGLLRLMGNKADVVKGLAKRCNENWSVAPKSDIGLYLSDIQDHLITMTQNLNHYEKILSRSHSNYLAQISIEMTDANNKINDVLSKLTALGTVLIPMNLITGLWGMNVHVPGEDIKTGYTWFLSIVGALVGLAMCGAVITYRLMSSR